MDDYKKKEYTTKEVATKLNISVPTVRKYSQVLEDENYSFMRSENDARIYVNMDINAFIHFIELRKAGISVKASANSVAMKFDDKEIQAVELPDTGKNKQCNKQYEELKQIITQIADKVDQQQKYIEHLLKGRNQQLIEHMDNTCKEKKKLKEF